MSKELDEFYKSYSARIIAIDDTPSVEVMDGGKFKLLSIEEYEEMPNKIADLEAKLAEKDKQIKELEMAFELCYAKMLYITKEYTNLSAIPSKEHFKQQAKERRNND